MIFCLPPLNIFQAIAHIQVLSIMTLVLQFLVVSQIVFYAFKPSSSRQFYLKTIAGCVSYFWPILNSKDMWSSTYSHLPALHCLSFLEQIHIILSASKTFASFILISVLKLYFRVEELISTYLFYHLLFGWYEPKILESTFLQVLNDMISFNGTFSVR